MSHIISDSMISTSRHLKLLSTPPGELAVQLHRCCFMQGFRNEGRVGASEGSYSDEISGGNVNGMQQLQFSFPISNCQLVMG